MLLTVRSQVTQLASLRISCKIEIVRSERPDSGSFFGLYTKTCVFLIFQSRIAELRLSAYEHAFQEEILYILESISLSSDCLY